MKKYIKRTSPLILLLLTSLLFIQCTDKTQKLIKQEAQEINKKSPIQLDMLTRLDGAEALPNHTLKYNYTLLMNSQSFDTAAFKNRMMPQLLYNLQTNDLMRSARAMKVTFIYTYKDDQGKPLTSITISPLEYNKTPIKPEPTDIKKIAEGKANLQQLVDATKSQLPINMEEQNLSIIDCQAVGGNTLEYIYQMHNENAAKFDSLTFQKTVMDNALQTLKGNQSITDIIEQNINISYIYLDKNKNYLCRITLTPELLK